jgi:hypothetical protein
LRYTLGHYYTRYLSDLISKNKRTAQKTIDLLPKLGF